MLIWECSKDCITTILNSPLRPSRSSTRTRVVPPTSRGTGSPNERHSGSSLVCNSLGYHSLLVPGEDPAAGTTWEQRTIDSSAGLGFDITHYCSVSWKNDSKTADFKMNGKSTWTTWEDEVQGISKGCDRTKGSRCRIIARVNTKERIDREQWGKGFHEGCEGMKQGVDLWFEPRKRKLQAARGRGGPRQRRSQHGH